MDPHCFNHQQLHDLETFFPINERKEHEYPEPIWRLETAIQIELYTVYLYR